MLAFRQSRRVARALRLGRNLTSVAASDVDAALSSYTEHQQLREFVRDMVELCKPDRVQLCDGSAEEDAALKRQAVAAGTLIPLNEEKRPNSFLARSSPSDVARVEGRTFICSDDPDDAGATNNWEDPEKMASRLRELFDGTMKGRTMYVVPYCMGPLGSDISKLGVQVTDSAYATANLRIMTRMGKGALDMLGSDGTFTPAIHSVGAPLEPGQADVAWPSNENKYITHFTGSKDGFRPTASAFADRPHIVSYGSGYGGNCLLPKKCHALRIASVIARDEGWMAEHMLILKLTNPAGESKHIAACFPSACGKTNLAMLEPDLPGWKVECVGDDIAWLKPGPDGRLRAINPEAGFFGVAPGTSDKTNPNAMRSLDANCIFTNVALTDDMDVWWEGMSDPPARATSWLGRDWRPQPHLPKAERTVAAHPNSRFTAPASQCPIIADNWEDPAGVPIDAILMGGRRSTTVPLVTQALDWEHGVYMGATMLSENTAAQEGSANLLRSDPFAMKPFIGYNVVDYLAHWLEMGRRHGDALPNLFFVNWFRKSQGGDFLWPGFGSNARVLEWVFHRCNQQGKPTVDDRSVEAPIGFTPKAAGGLDTSGLDVSPDAMEELLRVDKAAWQKEMEVHRKTLDNFGARLPDEVNAQHSRIAQRVEQA